MVRESVSSLTILAAAVPPLGLAQMLWANDFPSIEHGRYVAEVADVAEFVPVKPAAVLSGEGFHLRVGKAGKMQINTGLGSYSIESCFSYPGNEKDATGKTIAKIGWNGLPRGFSQDNYPDVTSQLGAEPSWAPEVEKRTARAVTIEATGDHYALAQDG